MSTKTCISLKFIFALGVGSGGPTATLFCVVRCLPDAAYSIYVKHDVLEFGCISVIGLLLNFIQLRVV